MRYKIDAFVSFREWLVMVEKETGNLVKTVRADKGGEFTLGEMQEFCAEKGIQREFANTGTPSENGVVERKNRTVVEMARTMLAHRSLP